MPATATLTADRESIPLSKNLTLQATLQGPAPLRVEVPANVLSDEAAPLWEVIPLGAATLVDLPGGQQRWSQQYTASPFAAGKVVPLSFREFTAAAGNDVSAKSIAFPALQIQVETKIAKIDVDQAIPATGIEFLPPAPPSDGVPAGIFIFGIAVGLLLIVGLVFALRRRKPIPELPPGERALRDLDALISDATLPDRLAAILRTFTAKQFTIPAETLTTAELAKAHPDEELRTILEACDRARFAGLGEDAPAGMELAERARGWILRATVLPDDRRAGPAKGGVIKPTLRAG